MQEIKHAAQYKAEGCNCAQAVLLSLRAECGVKKDTACRAACGFGGGMRAGELCGAATGAVMAIGLALGNSDARDTESRDRAYAAVIEFNRRFKERFGTLICRELLGVDTSTPEGKQRMAEQPEIGKICPVLVSEAECMARALLREYGICARGQDEV